MRTWKFIKQQENIAKRFINYQRITGRGKIQFSRPNAKGSPLSIQFCRVSRGSLMELIDDLNVCIDEKYFFIDYLEELKEEGYRVNKMLNGYIAYLKKRRNEKSE